MARDGGKGVGALLLKLLRGALPLLLLSLVAVEALEADPPSSNTEFLSPSEELTDLCTWRNDTSRKGVLAREPWYPERWYFC